MQDKRRILTPVNKTETETNLSLNDMAKFKAQESDLNKDANIVKSTFLEVFGDSKIHGVSNIIKNKSVVMKSIWFCLFLAGVGACTYYIYTTLTLYFAYDTTTTVSKYLQTLQTFPSVTVCNINPINTNNSYAASFVNNTLTNHNNDLNLSITPGSNQNAIYLVREYMNLLKANALLNSVNGNASYIKSIGWDISTLLISCYFNGKQCSASDFTYYFTFEYGNCYIFNYQSGNDTLKMTSQSGPSSGLQLELFAGYPGSGDAYMEQTGFYISVNNNTQKPLTKYEGVKIATGYATNIAIEKTYYYKLDEPYSDCRKDVSTVKSTDSTYYKDTLKINEYSQKLCFDICLQYMYIIPVCQCADPSIPPVDDSQTICHTLSDLDCVNNVTYQFNSVDSSLSCGQYCPLECDTEEFTYWMSMSNYPTNSYYSIISQQSSFNNKFTFNSTASTILPTNQTTPTANQTTPTANLTTTTANNQGNGPGQSIALESCALVNIYLEDMYYTEIDESPAITVDGVFGVIGGQLGLYLGASILTFFELIEFFGNSLYKFFRNRNSRATRNFNQNV